MIEYSGKPFKQVWQFLNQNTKQLAAKLAPYLTTTDCCPVNDGQDNLVIADNSSLTANVGPGSTHLIDNFSGMLIVNDHYDGRVETWICGGGDGILLGYTNVGAGPCTSTLTIISNGYEWHNNDNLIGPFTFTVIKTRNGA